MADPKDRMASILEKLKKTDHKRTPQRLAVVKILAGSKGHPSVEQIYEQLKVDFPTMSLATVYRNVMLVKSLEEVLELGFPDGSNRYDGNKPYPHPHVICVQCKKIIDPDLDSLNDMAREVARETGFQILTHRLDFFGICPECRHKAKP
ncbi:MAG: transcriptional repressor [Desulfobacterales bacterium]|nr:transcriptional repressor [Desulfobacterales bacterium]